MKKIEVVAAIISYDDKILCVQRNTHKFNYISKKYEFPGGKIEGSETHQEALKREVMEELNMIIDIKEHYLTVEHSYPDFHLIMHSYLCQSNTSKVTLLEHSNYQWLCRSKIQSLDWAAADIPIVEKLKNIE